MEHLSSFIAVKSQTALIACSEQPPYVMKPNLCFGTEVVKANSPFATMIESRLLVAKPTLFAFLLNRRVGGRAALKLIGPEKLLFFFHGRDCCLVVGRGNASTTAPLPRLASDKALLASLALACAKAESPFH